jgi:hypothetical protein
MFSASAPVSGTGIEGKGAAAGAEEAGAGVQVEKLLIIEEEVDGPAIEELAEEPAGSGDRE